MDYEKFQKQPVNHHKNPYKFKAEQNGPLKR